MLGRRVSDEPWEVVHLAAASLRLVGGIFLLMGVAGMLTLGLVLGFDGFDPDRVLLRFVTNTLPYLAAAGAFLYAARYVNRRRRWAVVVALCLTSGACLVAMAVLVSLIALAQTREFESILMAIPIVLVAAFTYACGRLIFHLAATFEAMRQLDNPRPSTIGFEAIPTLPDVVLPPPPLPVPGSDGGSHADPAQG
jgi:peptidoglycan/LPS O-acetylase OafA/YrhL